MNPANNRPDTNEALGSGAAKPKSQAGASGQGPPPAELWNSRYGASDYVYGTEPNDFLNAHAKDLPVGKALCLADGEGRNGVYLACLGHEVTSVDLAGVGLQKAAALAAERGVALTTIEADLADYDMGSERWDLIVSIFAHVAPELRAEIHGHIRSALRPGGLFILEAYTPDQIGRGTGGPPIPALTMTLDGLRSELKGLTIEHGLETIRPVIEGTGHSGDGAVVQVTARREPS